MARVFVARRPRLRNPPQKFVIQGSLPSPPRETAASLPSHSKLSAARIPSLPGEAPASTTSYPRSTAGESNGPARTSPWSEISPCRVFVERRIAGRVRLRRGHGEFWPVNPLPISHAARENRLRAPPRPMRDEQRQSVATAKTYFERPDNVLLFSCGSAMVHGFFGFRRSARPLSSPFSTTTGRSHACI